MAFNFLKSLDADDIFISYSRQDGSAYLTGLDAALSARGFSCFTDKRGTDAGPTPPDTLFEKVKACKTLVLLATPGAIESPVYITPELEQFAGVNGTARIICVSFDHGAKLSSLPEPWHPFVGGKAREREAPDALKTGTPSEAVVAFVATASNYMKSKDRLRKYRNRAIGVLGLLVVAIVVAAVIAGLMSYRAAAATAEANTATRDAETALAQAIAVQAEALVARTDAEVAKADAAEQKRLAGEAAREAEEKTQLAEAAGRRAELATARAAAARDDATRQQKVALSSSLAASSQSLLRLHPEEFLRSLNTAVESMELSLSARVHASEADSALRNALALFPRVTSANVDQNENWTTALSPDGRHFATLDMIKRKLRVYESGRPAPIKERECNCTHIALSDGLDYLAAVIDGRVKIINLKVEAAGPRDVSLSDHSLEEIALSPGGRYLAVVLGEGRLKVLDVDPEKPDAEYGKVVASLDKLNMTINDVAFGPSGNLAVGGYSGNKAAGRPPGKVVVWPLRLNRGVGTPEPELTAASFRPEEFFQDTEVRAVAPGVDDTSYATDTVIWKRRPNDTRFEPAAVFPRLSYAMESYQIVHLTFHSDGRSLAVLKVPTPGMGSGVPPGLSLEIWEAEGQLSHAQVFHPDMIDSVSFRPGEQLVAAASKDKSGGTHVRLFRADDGGQAGEAAGPGPEDGSVVYSSPGSGLFVTADDEAAQVWDIWAKKKTCVPFGARLQSVRAAVVGPGGKYLALYGRNRAAEQQASVVVYRPDGDSYRELKVLAQGDAPSVDWNLSAGGRLLAAGESGEIRLWDTTSWKDVTPPYLRLLKLFSPLSLSPGGHFIASGGFQGPSTLVNLSSGRVSPLPDTVMVRQIAFSQDERYLGLGLYDGFLHVFETDSPEREVARIPLGSDITALAFGDDNKYVVTASDDARAGGTAEKGGRVLRIWLLQPGNLIAEARERVRQFTQSAR